MYKLKIVVISLFPIIFKNFINIGIVKKSILNKVVKIYFINIRNSYKERIDDYSYGGKRGMVLMCKPIYDAIIKAKKILRNNSKVIYLTPQGKIIDQNYINNFYKRKSVIILCGRYEGIDQRIIDLEINEEISIGNYILSCGEIPAMVLIDSVIRTIPGILNINSLTNDSFNKNLLDYPHYTRPKIFMNLKVPSILLSGNHKKIYEWRLNESIKNTKKKQYDSKKK